MSDISGELVEIVKSAYQQSQPLKIVGANTKEFLGRNVGGQVVNVGAHSGILEYQPVELVLTARAGTSLLEIQQALAEQQQMLSFEPPVFSASAFVSSSGATLGGTLAANLSGPSRPWTGSIRDMVLGVKLINGRGELLNFGGKVMKNVAGYDLARTQAGALGGLGLMTEISLKVLPKPQLRMSLSVEIDETAAILLMNQLSASAKPIDAACWVNQRLYLRLSGSSSSVEQSAKQWQLDYGFKIEQQGEKFWRDLTEYQLPQMDSQQPLWRFSINPTSAPLNVRGECIIDWGGAQRWVSGEQDLAQLQQQAEQAGGSVALWRNGDRSSEVNHPLPVAMQQLQQRLKHSLDPKNIFNPGRLYSWL